MGVRLSSRPGRVVRVIASLGILLHLAAVFSAPASVPPASPAAQASWSFFSPYLHATNLNHGYHFFAPEPGASTLLEYVGYTSEGEQRRGVLPDKQMMRPRLLYHRYFMLTEFLGSMQEGQPMRDRVVQNYALQLLKTKQLDRIELRLVRHRPSTRQEILVGGKLDDQATYQREKIGDFTWATYPSPESSDDS
jgi:hypothetical protein